MLSISRIPSLSRSMKSFRLGSVTGTPAASIFNRFSPSDSKSQRTPDISHSFGSIPSHSSSFNKLPFRYIRVWWSGDTNTSVLPCTETLTAQSPVVRLIFLIVKGYSLDSPDLLVSQNQWSSSAVSGFSHHHSASFST